jgi:hypothetical protein
LLIWILIPLIVVGVGAVAAAIWWRWDTARQPAVLDAVPTLRRAVAEAVVAAGPDAAAAVSGVVRSSQCRINAVREGGTFTARADLYTDPGAEDALITGIAERLSGTYPVRRGTAVSAVRPLEADVGQGVRLAVRRLGAGWLTVSARTGCSLGAVAGQQSPPAGSPGVAAVTATFAALGTRPAAFVAHQLDCPGGSLITVAAVSEPVDSARLAERLAATVPAGARRFASGESNRVVYRDGAASVIVAASDDGTTITSQHTTGCQNP